MTDWDADGDLDFWISNRNGPRIRFLKNDYRANHHFLALQLQGVSCNRDAIGREWKLKSIAPTAQPACHRS